MGKEDMVYIHNGILLSCKQDKITLFAETWMDLEIIISEVSQIEKDKCHMRLLCVEPRKHYTMIQMNLFSKQKQTDRGNKCMVPEGARGGIYQKFGVDRNALLYM